MIYCCRTKHEDLYEGFETVREHDFLEPDVVEEVEDEHFPLNERRKRYPGTGFLEIYNSAV